MDRIKPIALAREIFERVTSVKLERVVRLWTDIHTYYVKAGPVISHTGTTGAAKQI